VSAGFTRRTLLGAAAFAGAPALLLRASAQETRALPVPPLIDARSAREIRLTAQEGNTEFMPGVATRTAGYNGSFLGPTIRVHSGTDVPFVVRSELSEPTTVHWHGVLIPSEVDGGPHNELAPGGEWKPVLPIRQPAATAWYHAHPHMRTGPQVWAGLAGMMIVTDSNEQALGLPSRYGVDDLPLILQDRLFDREGRMVYPRNHMAMMHGAHGNVLLVNGAREPRADVPAGWVRLRLLNGANARNFGLAFEDQRPFHWIASDGGLLREPVRLTRLLLAPAQRAEVLVDLSDGRPATLVNHAGNGIRPLVHLVPSGRGEARPLPAQLARWNTPAHDAGTRRRRMTLTMGMDGMGMGMGGGMRGMPGMGGAQGMAGMHGIDGRSFDMARVDHQVRLGDVEIWQVSSQPTMMMDIPHPFHIHGVHFEVLSRDGRPPRVEDQGLRDTVLVDSPVELLVQFTQPAPRMPFMYHCHILEHEDMGMMGQFTVA
jgi:FtsP/CotA-like multicopper oxidase with cupredoxin domain